MKKSPLPLVEGEGEGAPCIAGMKVWRPDRLFPREPRRLSRGFAPGTPGKPFGVAVRFSFNHVCRHLPQNRRELEGVSAPSRGDGETLNLWVARDVEIGVPGVVIEAGPAARQRSICQLREGVGQGTRGMTRLPRRPASLGSSASTTRPGPWFAILTTPSALAGKPYHPVRGISAPHGGKDGGLNRSGSVGRRYTSV